MVYIIQELLTSKAAETVKMTLDEGAARLTNHTYHGQPHTGDRRHYVFPGDDGMEVVSLLPKCALQDNTISALAKVAGEWLQEAGGAETGGESGGEWMVAAIRRARYRRAESMIRENKTQIFRMIQKGPAAMQWRGQEAPILLLDDRLGDRGTAELEVRCGQGARYQYNVQGPNVLVTTATAEGIQFCIGLSRKGQAVKVYTMGH